MLKSLFICALTLSPWVSQACGITLHTAVGLKAIEYLDEGSQLREFAECHRQELMNGCIFPDSGIKSGYAEDAHMVPFRNAYMDYIKTKCVDADGKLELKGECGRLTAYFLGVIAHQTTDDNFDWHFLDAIVAHNQSKSSSAAQQLVDKGLDMISIWNATTGFHFNVPRFYSPKDDIVEIFKSINETIDGRALNREDLDCGTNLVYHVMALERPYSLISQRSHRKTVPQWAQDHYIDGVGGVNDSAQVVAEHWKETWRQLTEMPRSEYTPKTLVQFGRWPHRGSKWVPTAQIKNCTPDDSYEGEFENWDCEGTFTVPGEAIMKTLYAGVTMGGLLLLYPIYRGFKYLHNREKIVGCLAGCFGARNRDGD